MSQTVSRAKAVVGLSLAHMLRRIGSPVKKVKRNPLSLNNWMLLTDSLMSRGRLDVDAAGLVNAHRLTDEQGPLSVYAKEISDALSSDLVSAATILDKRNQEVVVKEIVEKVVKKKTILRCRDAHISGPYYAEAERYMEWQWNNLIYPAIKDKDLSVVLELAPGHGRNTEKLRSLAKEIHLVDVNQTCIEACRERFGEMKQGCRFYYYVNDGNYLKFIKAESITLVYSFDSMVHFDKLVVRDYVVEFSRIMKPGAFGFVHHSNLGSIERHSDWERNHGSRSDVSAEGFREYCASAGLEVTSQRLLGPKEGVGMENLDCISVFKKV